MLIDNVHAYYTYKAGKDQAGKPNLELWNTESAEKVAELIQKKQRGWCVCCIIHVCDMGLLSGVLNGQKMRVCVPGASLMRSTAMRQGSQVNSSQTQSL